MTTEEIKKQIAIFEKKELFENDPVSFLWLYKDKRDIEVAAVICSVLAFGNRKQIYKACEKTLALMGNSPYQYIMEADFKSGNECWYRMLKWNDFYSICDRLYDLYHQHYSLEDTILECVDYGDTYLEALIDCFGDLNGFPKDKKSTCKRLNLLLRWLIRQNSPVDVGIWTKLDASKLLLPMDTHSLKTARKHGLLERKSNDFKAVCLVTKAARKICPKDPASLDFFLFAESYLEAHPDEDVVKMTPDQVILTSIYQCIYLNEFVSSWMYEAYYACLDEELDKEAKKILNAAMRRVKQYEKRMDSVIGGTGGVYYNYCDLMDERVKDIAVSFQTAIFNHLKTVNGVENHYICSLVETTKQILKFSIDEISNRIRDCKKYSDKAVSLEVYKQKELLDILKNLSTWIFRKADDINFNDSPECVSAWIKLTDMLTNPNVIGECIIKSQEIADKENGNK